MLNVAFHTLGCKVNQYETEVMMGQFQQHGYHIVDFSERADIYVVNTCTVTHLSDRKSRQMLRRAKRTNPDAVVVAVGCYAQIAPEKVSEIDAVDLILGNVDKSRIVEIVEDQEEIRSRLHIGDICQVREFEEMHLGELHETTRAFIKIQDGCNQFCSYCIIPHARGRVRSRRSDQILSEVEDLASVGCKEIVLTGIHIASYGSDLGGHSLFELVELLQAVPGIERIRLGSLEQESIDETFETLAPRLTKLCPHFHLSLQSGSDAVLRRMNRHYTTRDFQGRVARIRRLFPDAAITTDVIVGFPGETEQHFEETMAFVERMGFTEVHVFKYSPRAGTPAAAMTDQVDESVKSERSLRMIRLAEELRSRDQQALFGRIQPVLFENHHGNRWYGHTPRYTKVWVDSDQDLTNEIVDVRLTEPGDDHMLGEITRS